MVMSKSALRNLCRGLVLVLGVCLVTPVAAQSGPDLGAAPTTRLDRLFGELIGRIDPYLGQLAEMLGDLSGWHAPEVLPNGDILIRRRQPGEAAPEGDGEADDAADDPVLEPLEL